MKPSYPPYTSLSFARLAAVASALACTTVAHGDWSTFHDVAAMHASAGQRVGPGPNDEHPLAYWKNIINWGANSPHRAQPEPSNSADLRAFVRAQDWSGFREAANFGPLVLPEEAFDHPDDLVFELLTPAPYDAAVHLLAEHTGNFRGRVERRGVSFSRIDGAIVLDIPVLDPWGILRIRSASLPGTSEKVSSPDLLGLLGEKRWAFLGDSITHSGRYHRYVENFLVTRFPQSDLLIFNHGIGGDTAAGGLSRLDWDVFASRPTVVSVMYGMNDVGRSLYFSRDPSPETRLARAERLDAYRENMTRLVKEIEERGARVVLVTPSPADDTMISDPMVHYEVNEGLVGAAAIVGDLAKENGLPLVSIFEPMRALNLALQEENPTATLVGRDRVHPGVEGHFLMAYLWLLKMFAEIPVSTVNLDVEAGSVLRQTGGRVLDLGVESGGIAFEWHADSLPFPIPHGAKALAERLAFGELFNREILAVQGLAPGYYQLFIDGESILISTAAEWSAGIDLSAIESETPQMRQARRVVETLERKQDIQQTLSDIAFCELGLWGNRPRPVDLEKMRALTAKAKEAELGRNSPRSSVIRRYREYGDLKIQEEELRQKAMDLSREARDQATPVQRKFVLKKINEESTELNHENVARWLCAGQSNMAFRVSRAEDRDEILRKLEGATVYVDDSLGWTLVTKESAPRLSAVGLSFAASLSRKLDRPVAISVAAAGGTTIDAWLPLEGFPADDEANRLAKLVADPEVLAAAAKDAEDFRPAGQHRLAQWGLGRAVPTALFEKHIRPLQEVPFDGVLWYQGESNTRTPAQAAEYEVWLRALIRSYRDFFKNPKLPFVIVQLPRFERANAEANEAWSILRNVQQKVAESMENVGWVDIFDLGDPNDIHPVRKQEVGERAAVVAAKLDET